MHVKRRLNSFRPQISQMGKSVCFPPTDHNSEKELVVHIQVRTQAIDLRLSPPPYLFIIKVETPSFFLFYRSLTYFSWNFFPFPYFPHFFLAFYVGEQDFFWGGGAQEPPKNPVFALLYLSIYLSAISLTISIYIYIYKKKKKKREKRQKERKKKGLIDDFLLSKIKSDVEREGMKVMQKNCI